MNASHTPPSAEEEYAREECPAMCAGRRRRLTIGFPACNEAGERRFPLTPEGAAAMTERGFTVMIESGAGSGIHYTDERYTRRGASAVSRAETFGSDIVVYLAPPAAADVAAMKRGATLLTLQHAEMQSAATVIPLLQKAVTTIALDLIEDKRGNTPYADILAEIDGRAAVTLGASILADPARGKGILLGGVAGIVPCEVMVIGSGIAAQAAARVASGLGAMVRMFDNDVYSLRRNVRDLGPWVVASSLHPHVVGGALRGADIVIAAPHGSDCVVFGADDVSVMKRGAVVIDLSASPGAAFPSLQTIDISDPVAVASSLRRKCRVCMVNPGLSVARTAAMAFSDTMLTTFDRIFAYRSITEALGRLPGLRRSVVTFLGRVVNQRTAAAAGIHPVDISIYLTLS